MTQNKYKVIIIGAGPSGLATALNLKKQGINNILVVEQFKFPRYKCCAGYITNKTKKAYEKLGLDIAKCHYSLIKDFNIFYKFNLRQTIRNKFLYTNKLIDRVELDYKFYQTAKKYKIKILENTKIINHEKDKNMLTLSNKSKFIYEYLVFADGTLGYGSKYQKICQKNIAMQVTFPSSMHNKIDIHFGITKKGYAWISTYNGITNVGLTDIYNEKENYKQIFKSMTDTLNLKYNPKNIRGAFTPIGIQKGIINNNIYYVGDAVGACDPLTLSGLRYSLETGKKCAEAITKNKESIYISYLYKLKIRFQIMKILQKIFYIKFILFLIFNIGCRYFNKIIAFIFNNFFINKK